MFDLKKWGLTPLATLPVYLCLLGTAHGQSDEFDFPRLMVRPEQSEVKREPMRIDEIDQRVVVSGSQAQVSTTMRFANPAKAVLDGELVFPLPEGATVTGYALDIEGELVEASVVERHQARIAYETEVRKGVDPGLIEKVTGNNFRTRVWPVPAEGHRTVRVRYSMPTLTLDGSVRLHLPMAGPHVKKQSLVVEARYVDRRPVVVSGGPEEFFFDHSQFGFEASSALGATGMLVVDLGPVPESRVMVESFEGESHFLIEDFVDLSEWDEVDRALASLRRVGVFWDASLSREKTEKRRHFALLRQLKARYPMLQFDLFVFRDQPSHQSRVFGDVEGLIEHLEALVYDGGTHFSELILPAGSDALLTQDDLDFLNREAVPFDAHLLFSDGVDTMGTGLPWNRHASQAGATRGGYELPIYTVTSAGGANHILLRHIAENSGGAYLNLNRMDDRQALAALTDLPFRFLGVAGDSQKLDSVTLLRQVPFAGRLVIAGKLQASEAKIELQYGYGRVALHTTEVTINRSDAGDHAGLVTKRWAGMTADDLAVFSQENREQTLEIGMRYGLVTDHTSLLVLETLEQHLEHKIAPDPSRAELLAEYIEYLEDDESFDEKSGSALTDHVAEQWKERVEWWEKKFEIPDGPLPPIKREGRPSPPLLADGTSEDHRVIRGNIQADRDVPIALTQFSASDIQTLRVRDVGDLAGYTPNLVIRGQSRWPPSSITVKAWDPKVPYLEAIKAAGSADAQYAVYLKQREKFADSPTFYMDCANYFFQQGEPAIGRRIMTSALEIIIQDTGLMRMVAYRLQQAGELEIAALLLDQVRKLRPEEPQSYRDLALVLALRGERTGDEAKRMSQRATDDLVRALELFKKIVESNWNPRFPEIQSLAAMEFNRLFARAQEMVNVDTNQLPTLADERLVQLLDTDVRITITWDTDQTDMDLWVTEPSTESCSYQYRFTRIGGRMSSDMTTGYGPEEYFLRRAMPGTYQIQAKYFGSSSQKALGPTTVSVEIYTDYGRPTEKRQALTVRLSPDEDQKTVELGEVTIGAAQSAR
jgi:tetratricopeptide (TPR) repeat protein